MAILSINTNTTGLVGSQIDPRRVTIVTTDALATVIAAGYLNNYNRQGFPIFPSDIIDMLYLFDTATGTGTFGIFQPDFSGTAGSTTITLNAWENPGNVLLPVVDGDFAVFNGTGGQIKDASYSASDAAKTKVVMADAAVIIGHMATYTDVDGTISDDAATAINGGNIQAGLSGTAGTLASFPSAASTGSLKLTGVASGGAFDVSVSNASHAQSSVYSIPDGGQATSEFIIADSAGTQNITSGSLQVDAGDISAGSDANAGKFVSYPTTITSGTLEVSAVDNAGAFAVTISNASHAQSTVYSISDIGEVAGSLLTSTLDAVDPSSNLIYVDITIGHAALAGAEPVTIQASSGAKQYKLRNMWLNSGGTNFSGGGGDRLMAIGDGTSVYSIVPAASMQTLPGNDAWGESAALPYPVTPPSVAINTSSAAGASIVASYAGGATDYTAGSVVLTAVFERVA